ncbi:MAG: FlgD immunoglobulin-like domain containing protein [Candidatus Eisenbacteria bacterium]
MRKWWRSRWDSAASAALLVGFATLAAAGAALGANIVCDPSPQTLSASPGDVQTVNVDYLGGGSGLLYGFSIRFTWDSSVASTSTAAVTEGNLLSDQGLTWFEVHETGTDTIIVDCVLLGVQPGVSGPGTMFSIEFTGVAYGTSPVALTVVNVRDNANQELTGFVPDDGLLVVNLNAPAVTDVTITDTAIGSTVWVKDGDEVEIVATVSDADYVSGDGMTVTADLNGFYGGSGHDADSPASGAYPTYTWTVPLGAAVCSPSNGTVTVDVDVTDAVGNSGAGSDDIVADNTPPAEVSDLDATPHFHRVNLAWSAPADSWGVLKGIEIHRNRWNDYPEYAPPGPAYPGTPGPGETDYVGLVLAPGAAYDDDFPNDNANRDVYYYTVWAVDEAGNYSAAGTGSKDRATDYFLADIDAPGGGRDGYVDFFDVNRLSSGYHLFSPWSNPPPPPFNELDFAPTSDGRRFGIPVPDDLVDFEELMITALSFNDLSPTTKKGPVRLAGGAEAGPPRLGLRIVEEGIGGERDLLVCCRIGGNAGELKGAGVRIDYDPDRLEWLGTDRGADWSESGTLFFLAGREGRGQCWFDFAALGIGATVEGNGEIARLRFRMTGDETGDLRIASADLRGAANEPLGVAIQAREGGSPAPRSAATRLAGAWPNPFNPVTKVSFELERPSHLSLRVYDPKGRLVRTLLDGQREAGAGEALWDGRDERGRTLSSGVYFVRLEAGDYVKTSKLLLLK